MKALVKVDTKKAIRAGINKTGYYVVEFDPAQLTQMERDTLAKYDEVGWGSLSRNNNIPTDAINLAEVQSYKTKFPGMSDATIECLRSAILEVVGIEKKEKAEKEEKIKAHTKKFLDTPDANCLSDYEPNLQYYDWRELDKNDPEVTEKVNRLTVLGAEMKKEHEKEKAEKEEKEAEEKRLADDRRAAGVEVLRQWGIENGSDLLRLRIEENMNWQKLGETEFIKTHTPEGYQNIDGVEEVKDRTNPQANEILELRKLRELCAKSNGTLKNPNLAWYVMEREEDEYGDSEEEPEKFAVCRVEVVAPTGKTEWVEKIF